MRLAVIGAGVVAQAIAWRAVARGRGSVWSVMGPVLAVCGVAAAWARPPVASGRVSGVLAVAAGIGSGFAFYAGTIAFVGIATRWEPFRAQVRDQYGGLGRARRPVVLALAVLLAVPGEELFWRGLAQPRLQSSLPVLSGPAVAWLGYVGVNVLGESLPLIAGAIVGGAVWGALALWTDGVLASLLCHGVWTALMLLRPPAPAREMMQA
jgi:membrane protease YdiL (CAAX protease family)